MMNNETRMRYSHLGSQQMHHSLSNDNSLTIRQEIQRFESVHPSIYAIYDLIELIPDLCIAQHIRDHVVCIEDSFVNSQEWTLSRNVPDLRLGIIGSITSGKSALVHRYLTGSYMQEESPEGGRFKKEIVVDNQSYLLLIRDEGGAPEQQFTSWVDAVIFVFSLENETSFNAIYNYYVQMSTYRNPVEIPIILVGTQDAINETNPRVIDDNRARKLASELKRCSYYETCATYGLNVDRVFQDACQKIVQQKQHLNQKNSNCLTSSGSRPSTPSSNNFQPQMTGNRHLNLSGPSMTTSPTSSIQKNTSPTVSHRQLSQTHSMSNHHLNREDKWSIASNPTFGSSQTLSEFNNNNSNAQSNLSTKYMHPLDNLQLFQKDIKDLPTPSSTPTTSRKNRRKSNLFTHSKKTDEYVSKSKFGIEVGSGRVIPLKQGLLYKKSNQPLNKEWKKKYVTLCDDGTLSYHPSFNDYMNNIHGKEIPLQYVTVKVPGHKPRGSKSIITIAANAYHNCLLSEGINSLSLSKNLKKLSATPSDKVLLTAYEALRETDNDSNQLFTANLIENSMANIKKRHRRIKSGGPKNLELDDSDAYEFFIVSLDNRQWHFEAKTTEERDEWVTAIEQQILLSLQSNQSSKNFNSSTKNTIIQNALILSIKNEISGNDLCADCNASNPDWASLNYGILLCIECSGIHRNLGSHISKVRSLDLDEWTPSHLSVMIAVGNQMANSVWECRAPIEAKPEPNSSREKKEDWIRLKYVIKEFLPAKLNNSSSITQNIIDAICKMDVKNFITHLARIEPEQINGTISNRDQRTPLHLACATGNLAFVQLLIWSNANVSCLDQDGRTCLSYAQIASISKDTDSNKIKDLIDLLVVNGCPDLNDNFPIRLQNRDTIVFQKLPSSIV